MAGARRSIDDYALALGAGASLPADQRRAIVEKLHPFYESGHMVYAHEASLKAVHDNVAAFIVRSSNAKAK